MYKILANDGDVAYGIKDFICDTPEDLKDLPHCNMGCTAFIISTAEVYMINSNGEWVKI